jgi:hypothetical protein
VDGVVGRATGGHQRHDGIDDGLFVDQFADRAVIIAGGCQLQRPLRAGSRQGVAQLGARWDEAGAGQLQAHGFQQHLVGVGRAVESAGARRVVAGGLGGEQFLPAGQPGRVALAHRPPFPCSGSRWASARPE